MTRKDSIILGVITLIISSFMFCYFSGFDKTFVTWTVCATLFTLGLFFFLAYKKGLFEKPKK